jgi:hypothetical protein
MEKLRIADMPQFDMADYLETPEEIAHYLTAVLADNDPAELQQALGGEEGGAGGGLGCTPFEGAVSGARSKCCSTPCTIAPTEGRWLSIT